MKEVTNADRLNAASRRRMWHIASRIPVKDLRNARRELASWAERYPHADHTCTLRMYASVLRRRSPRPRAARNQASR